MVVLRGASSAHSRESARRSRITGAGYAARSGFLSAGSLAREVTPSTSIRGIRRIAAGKHDRLSRRDSASGCHRGERSGRVDTRAYAFRYAIDLHVRVSVADPGRSESGQHEQLPCRHRVRRALLDLHHVARMRQVLDPEAGREQWRLARREHVARPGGTGCLPAAPTRVWRAA